MRALGSLDNDLVGHLLEHRLEAVDHAWVGHVATVGLRVLLRLAGARSVTLDECVELAPLVKAQVVAAGLVDPGNGAERSEEPTSELQSLMRIPYAVFCLK